MKQKNQELIDFRKGKGLTQIELAQILDIPQSIIAMVENGSRKAPQSLKDALKHKFDFELDKVVNQFVMASTIVSIPLYDIAAAAGSGVYLTNEEPIKDVLYFDKRFLKQILHTDNFDSLHFIYASGNSMDSGWNQPDDIKDGDLLMVDTSQTTGNNQIFVILVNNQELRVKKLSKIKDTLYITSNNKDYKEEIYRPDNSDIEIKVIGKVIWNGSKETI
jgi:phage repressor protein C with HTH and peptisase S24 domain